MAGKRQPTDVVVAKRKKHMTKAEEEARREVEICVPAPQSVSPPKWLPKKLGAGFCALGGQLLQVGLYTELDADTLGRYLVAQRQWLLATKEAETALMKKDASSAKEWSSIQERYFKQCRACGSDMGLSISSRCRLVIPPELRPVDTDEGDEFTARLHARQAAGGT